MLEGGKRKKKLKSEQQWKTFSTFESRGLDGVQNTVEKLASSSDRHFVNSFASTDKTKNMTHSCRDRKMRCVTFVYIYGNTELIA